MTEDIDAMKRARDEAIHALGHALHAVSALRELVATAYAEGYQARVPDEPALWLVDWLSSKTKAELDALA